MRSPRTIELDLPFGEPQAEELEARRYRHLAALPGVDVATAARLARRFATLAEIYAASEDRLAAVIGPVAAARVRWFLDAPLHASTGGATSPSRRPRAA